MKRCQYCGQSGLRWRNIPRMGWRLFDGEVMHTCTEGLRKAATERLFANKDRTDTLDARPKEKQRTSVLDVARAEFRATFSDIYVPKRQAYSTKEILDIPTCVMSGPEFEFD